jgi:hypothetical protein
LEPAAAFGALRRFGFGVYRCRALIGSPPALERLFIASPRRLKTRHLACEISIAKRLSVTSSTGSLSSRPMSQLGQSQHMQRTPKSIHFRFAPEADISL